MQNPSSGFQIPKLSAMNSPIPRRTCPPSEEQPVDFNFQPHVVHCTVCDVHVLRLFHPIAVGIECRQTLFVGAPSPPIHSSLGIRHHPDSATVYVRLPAHEPLHLREDSDAPFRFSLELELLVAATEWPTGNQESRPNTMLHRFRWEDAANPDRRELVGRFTFPLSTGRYRIIHTIRDLHRGSDVTGVTAFDGWGNNAPERCLAFELATGEPAWNRSLPDGGRCGLLVPPDMIDLPWRHTAMPPVDSFPSAPFLDRIPKALSFPEDKSAPQRPIPVTEVPSDVFFPAGNWTGWSWVSWENAPGIHRWSYGDDSSSILVAARRRHFPVMRDLDQMIRATRYIATRQEYKTMRNARDPKKALDEFWLSFASGPDVARGLIATYYGRVREANVHFTSLKEGWCTDRGHGPHGLWPCRPRPA